MRLPFCFLVVLVSCSSHKAPIAKTDSANQTISINVLRKAWVGEWNRKIWQNDASLTITNIKEDYFDFSLQAVSGGHSGELKGTATVKDNVANFSTGEEYGFCVLEFTLLGDSAIAIKQSKGDCGAGVGVYYDGEYKNAKLSPQTQHSETLVDLGTFKNGRQDSAFRVLVRDHYDLFVNSTELTSEDDDLDGFHAMVKSSGVKGLFTIEENIIMIDSLDNIWAAVINNDSVYYFTNKQESRNKLPNSIEKWRERFEDYPIIYK